MERNQSHLPTKTWEGVIRYTQSLSTNLSFQLPSQDPGASRHVANGKGHD